MSGSGPAPIKVLPGENRPPELVNAVRGTETRDEWTDENGLLHIYETIDYHSPGLRVDGATAISVGHLASLSQSCTTYLGWDAPVAVDTVCGGGCITQKQQWTVWYYRNDQDPSNTYYQRREVRVWWERQYSTYINWSGNASTRFAELMKKCDNTNWSRDVTSTWAPAWQTDWRSYDYYWDETWMPIMGGPDTLHMLVQTTTPTNYGTNLFTQQIFE